MPSQASSAIPSLWKEAPSDPVDQLVYASNLLGSDSRITNFGGGNTSLKTTEADPLSGESVRVLWVKGSGGDLGTASKAGFASLYLDKVLGLEQRYREGGMHEDDVVPLYQQCVFNLNPAAPSIDTPLHAFVRAAAVSHMHSDAVIAIAASDQAEALTHEVWGEEMGFLPWKRPGFELGLMLQDLIRENPGIKGALMEAHGFICWAEDWQECYELTIRLANRAQEYIDAQAKTEPFGALAARAAEGDILDMLPELRGKVAFDGQTLIASVDTSDAVLDFLARERMQELAKLGTSCPDHFLRTKIRPLVLSGPTDIDSALEAYRKDYAAYYNRNKLDDSPAIRNPNPSVVLVPGSGMISFGKNIGEARVTGQFYRNAIEVMRGAERVGRYRALPEREAFNIEYWQLEEAKLRRQPPEKELSRQVAVITGAAQGIGRATALRMAELGAHLVLLDLHGQKLQEVVSEAERLIGMKGSAVAVPCDVTSRSALDSAFTRALRSFGGVDIVVANAGTARRGKVSETSEEDYKLLSDLLMKAYFDTLGIACELMVRQGTGGSLIVVSSKNAVAVGSNAALYSATKAFELHLMRSIAVDYASQGIRCNAVNPDAVLSGSGIWSEQWRTQTAESLSIPADQLEDHYRKRSLLQREVHPEQVAEAICWLASESRSSRTTGAVIPVDAGNKEGFLR